MNKNNNDIEAINDCETVYNLVFNQAEDFSKKFDNKQFIIDAIETIRSNEDRVKSKKGFTNINCTEKGKSVYRLIIKLMREIDELSTE